VVRLRFTRAKKSCRRPVDREPVIAVAFKPSHRQAFGGGVGNNAGGARKEKAKGEGGSGKERRWGPELGRIEDD